jgi:hypothetical protein
MLRKCLLPNPRDAFRLPRRLEKYQSAGIAELLKVMEKGEELASPPSLV